MRQNARRGTPARRRFSLNAHLAQAGVATVRRGVRVRTLPILSQCALSASRRCDRTTPRSSGSSCLSSQCALSASRRCDLGDVSARRHREKPSQCALSASRRCDKVAARVDEALVSSGLNAHLAQAGVATCAGVYNWSKWDLGESQCALSASRRCDATNPIDGGEPKQESQCALSASRRCDSNPSRPRGVLGP